MKTNLERLTDEQRRACFISAWNEGCSPGSLSELAELTESVINALPPELFDAAERLAAINRILDNAYDGTLMHYDVQAVNVAHRIASGGEMPCLVTMGENHDEV